MENEEKIRLLIQARDEATQVIRDVEDELSGLRDTTTSANENIADSGNAASSALDNVAGNAAGAAVQTRALGGAAEEASAGLEGTAAAGGSAAGAFLIIAAAAAIAAIVLGKLAAAAAEPTAKMIVLEDTLQRLSEKVNVVTALSEISGATENQSRAALTAAASNQEYAKRLEAARLEVEKSQAGLTAWGSMMNYINQAADRLGRVVPDAFNAASKAVDDFFNRFNTAEQIAAAIDRLTDATGEFNSIVAEGEDLTAKPIKPPVIPESEINVNMIERNISAAYEVSESYYESLDALAAQHSKTLEQLSANEVQVAIDAIETRTEVELDAVERREEIEENSAERIVELQQNTADRIVELQQGAADRIVELQQDAADRIVIAQREFTEDIAELDYDRNQRYEDLADDRLEIEQGLQKDIEQLSSDMAGKEADAKTWAEVEAIRRDAAARQKDLEDAASEKEAQLDEDRDAIDEEYNHRRTLYEQDMGEYISDLEAQTQKRIEEAEKQTQKQIEETGKQTQGQIEAVNEQTQKQIEAINKQESASIESINKIEAKQLVTLAEYRTAEDQNYEDSKVAAKSAADKQIESLLSVKTQAQLTAEAVAGLAETEWGPHLTYLLNIEATIKRIDEASRNPTSPGAQWGAANPYADVTGGWAMGYQSGGSGIVPPGFPNDTYPVFMSSGEKFKVIPKGGSEGPQILIQGNTIYGAIDLEQIVLGALEQWEGQQ